MLGAKRVVTIAAALFALLLVEAHLCKAGITNTKFGCQRASRLPHRLLQQQLPQTQPQPPQTLDANQPRQLQQQQQDSLSGPLRIPELLGSDVRAQTDDTFTVAREARSPPPPPPRNVVNNRREVSPIAKSIGIILATFCATCLSIYGLFLLVRLVDWRKFVPRLRNSANRHRQQQQQGEEQEEEDQEGLRGEGEGGQVEELEAAEGGRGPAGEQHGGRQVGVGAGVDASPGPARERRIGGGASTNGFGAAPPEPPAVAMVVLTDSGAGGAEGRLGAR